VTLRWRDRNRRWNFLGLDAAETLPAERSDLVEKGFGASATPLPVRNPCVDSGRQTPCSEAG